MKTILSTISIALLFTACTSSPQTGNEGTAAANTRTYVADTSGLAEFQAWKAYQADLAASQYRFADAQPEAPLVHQAVKKTAAAPKRSTSSAKRSSDNNVSNTSNTSTAPVAQPQKKGWSKAAKGAAIGAGSGAVIGAVIHKKNRVAGGVIGGAVGAGVGYGIGRTMDKKDGRY
jgi:hypothetical protein